MNVRISFWDHKTSTYWYTLTLLSILWHTCSMFTVHICCFVGQKSNIRYGAPFHNVRYTLYHSFCCIVSFTVLQKKANKKQRFTSCRSGKACASYPPSIQVAVAMWSIDVWEKNSRSLVLNGSFVVYGNPPNKMVGLFQSSMVGFPILPIGQVWSKWTSWGNMKNVFQCFRVIGIIISNAKYWWFGKYTDFQK